MNLVLSVAIVSISYVIGLAINSYKEIKLAKMALEKTDRIGIKNL